MFIKFFLKGGRFWVNYCRSVCSLAGIPQFSEFANKIAMKKRNCIITDQVLLFFSTNFFK